mgnify:CR=1 FL=1
MINQLLYTSQQSSIIDYATWIVLLLIAFVMVYFIFLQFHHSRQLKSELAELSKLQKHNVEYEFVLKAMRLCVWHIDPKTHIVTYEQDYRDKSGDIVSLADGGQFDEGALMLDPRDRDRVMKSMEAICSGQTNEYHEIYRVLTPYSAKSFYWEEAYATVADRDVDGTPSVIVGTSMRVDKRKEMEEALVLARNRAEESDRLKSAFIANMSHEIRTPLNAIIGFTSILPDVDDAAERKGLLDLVHENTQKLLLIIDDIVNISKVEAGQDELVMTAFDLNQTLTEQADRYAGDLPAGVQLTTAFADDQLNIITDHNRFTEIVKHLLSNAVKFTSQGSITVGYDKPSSGRVHVWIRDTGKGISEENRKRVFERFFKVDEFIPGAGLGLSVCQTLVQSLGGEMGVESKLGEGSTFWFQIPVQ